MWYVIQTRTGFEIELAESLKSNLGEAAYRSILVPLYENVRRTGGVSRITHRRLFPGYVLIETDRPEDVMPAFRKVNEFARILGAEEEAEDPQGTRLLVKTPVPVGEEDMSFLESVLVDGVMTVSYVENVRGNKIGKIVGPLAKYGNRITSLEFRKRRAIVEAEIFGKTRKLRFGLWTDQDPKIPWIESGKKNKEEPEYLLQDMDIGIHPGDKVRDLTGVYGEEIFVVETVNPLQRTLKTKLMLFGEWRDLEMYADGVEKLG